MFSENLIFCLLINIKYEIGPLFKLGQQCGDINIKISLLINYISNVAIVVLSIRIFL